MISRRPARGAGPETSRRVTAVPAHSLPWMHPTTSTVLPGLAPSDHLTLNNQAHTPLSLQDAAKGIKALYEDMLDRAWSDAKARGEKLPSESQKAIPPTVPGQQ